MPTVLEVYDRAFKHLAFNRALADKLFKYRIAFVSKNTDHIEFFGGNLTGIHAVKFTPSDMNRFFGDVLQVDYDDLTDAIATCAGINQSFVVSSDTFNITAFYILHRLSTSPNLDKKNKHDAMVSMGLILNYRYLTSLLSHYFKYPTTLQKAQLTYANLNGKFKIKQLGSWQSVMEYRAESIIEPGSIHERVIKDFSPDDLIVYSVNDTQGRVRDTVKSIYAEFIKVHQSGTGIKSTSSFEIDVDGNETLKDKIHGLEVYVSYIHTVVMDKHSFFKRELVNIVLDLMPTTPQSSFIKVLEYIGHLANGDAHQRKRIDDLLRLVIVHSFDYLQHNSTVLNKTHDLPAFMDTIRGAYLSSRSTDPNLLRLRDEGRDLVRESLPIKNENLISSLRTTMFLYVCLRTYTKHHYASN